MTITLPGPVANIYQSLSQVYIIKYPRIPTSTEAYITSLKEFLGTFEVLRSPNYVNEKYNDIYLLPIINPNIVNLIFPLLSVEQSGEGGVKTVGNVIEASCNLSVSQSINTASVTVKNPTNYFWLDIDDYKDERQSRCVFEPEDIVVIKLPGKDNIFRFSFVGFISSIKNKKNKENEEWLLTIDCEGITRKLKKTRIVTDPGTVRYSEIDAKSLSFENLISRVAVYNIPFTYIEGVLDKKTITSVQSELDLVNNTIAKRQWELNNANYSDEYMYYVRQLLVDLKKIKNELTTRLTEVSKSKIGFNMLDILTEIMIRTYSVDSTYLTLISTYEAVVKSVKDDYSRVNTTILNNQIKVLEDEIKKLDAKANPKNFSTITENLTSIQTVAKNNDIYSDEFGVNLASTPTFIQNILIPFKTQISSLIHEKPGVWDNFYKKIEALNSERELLNDLKINLDTIKNKSSLTSAEMILFNTNLENALKSQLNNYRKEFKTSSKTSSGYAIYSQSASSRTADDLPICIIVGTDQPPFDISFNTGATFFTHDYKENHYYIQEIVSALDYEFFESEMGILFIKPSGIDKITPEFDSAYKLTFSDVASLDSTQDVSSLYSGILVSGNEAISLDNWNATYYDRAAQWEDRTIINKYGYLGYAPSKVIYGLNTRESCLSYAKALLRRNNRKNEFKMTVKLDRGDARLKIGNWVWIEETNELYFIEKIDHSFTPIEYEMTLNLHSRRIPLFSFDEIYDTNNKKYQQGALIIDLRKALDINFYDEVTSNSFLTMSESDIVNFLYFNGFIWEPVNFIDYSKIVALQDTSFNSSTKQIFTRDKVIPKRLLKPF